MAIEVRAASPELWPDLETLFRASPATRGCWCVWPRVPAGAMWGRSEAENHAHLRADVASGSGGGLLAYVDGRPAGWCSVAPLDGFGRFEATTPGVWAVTCLFVLRRHRGQGVSAALLVAATGLAASAHAAEIVGLPRGWRPEAGAGSIADVSRRFAEAGFEPIVDDDEHAFLFRKAAEALSA